VITSDSRIYIDCAFVDFTKQPTGIPRVVLKYIEVGYQWASRNNIEVVPVVASTDSFVICRPVPGLGAPQSLLDKVRVSEILSNRITVKSMAKNMFSYCKNIAHHLLFLTASVLPFPAVKATAVWIDDYFEKMRYAIEKNSASLTPIKFKPRKGDVLLAAGYWHDADPTIYETLRTKGVVIVVLLHDLLPIVFENLYPSPWRYLFRENVCKAFGYAAAFFCVSNFTKATLLEFSYRQRTPPVPMMTAYNGFEPLVCDAAANQIKKGGTKPLLGNTRYYAILDRQPLLMVGSVEPKKGHVPVIKCLEAMWSAGFERPLVIVGRTGWMESDIVSAIEGSFFYRKKLFWFSDIDDYDLAVAYLFCHALIFSSMAEGFGLPMIEASHYGKPTIAFDTMIVREVLGDKGLLFSSAAGFVQHVADLEDTAKYAAACAAAESVKWPSWSEYTSRVFDVLATLGKQESEVPDQIVVPRNRTLDDGPNGRGSFRDGSFQLERSYTPR
jgi:glycosyltransferase involved in cell wall biosynthesis